MAPVKLGGVHSGPGNDRISGDYPKVNGQPSLPTEWQNNLVLRKAARYLSAQSTDQLFARFAKEYTLVSHCSPVATTQFNHFRANSGATVVSKPGSEMSRLVAQSGEGRELARTFISRLQDSAQEQLDSSLQVDVSKLKIDVSLSDRPSWSKNPTNPMFGLVGSTDGVSAQLLNGRYHAQSRRLTGAKRITVNDRLGLSNQDYDSPGQISMWLLQHQRGFKSFENQIAYDVPVNVTLLERRVQPEKGCSPRLSCPVP